jgi:hypothetical protein
MRSATGLGGTLRVAAAIAGAVLLASPPLHADQEIAPGVTAQVHGFVSQGFIKSSDNNYLASSERGSFEFTEVGVNLTVALGDDLRAGMQLFGRDLGPIGNYEAKFDWFYLDYRFADWLGIRAGRTKLPFGLYNESSDVDAARVPILLPQAVYPIENRDLLLAQTGVELYGRVPIGPAGDLAYRIYGGTVFLDPTTLQGASTTAVETDVPYLIGGRLMWEPPLEGLQLGASAQALELSADLDLTPETIAQYQALGLLPADFTGAVNLTLPALLWVASVEYAGQDLLLAAEYSRWHIDIESNAPTLLPETETVSERLYGMVAYRMAPWFTPGAYYSLLFPNVDDREGRDSYQHDFAVTVRYDVTPYWLIKAEGHYMHGTAALNPALNDNVQRDALRRDWGVGLAKTTVYF